LIVCFAWNLTLGAWLRIRRESVGRATAHTNDSRYEREHPSIAHTNPVKDIVKDTLGITARSKCPLDQSDGDGAMVGAVDVAVDLGFPNLHREPLRGEDVVNAPPYVTFACGSKVAPPRVVAVTLGVEPKGVNETIINVGLEARALLFGVALQALILLGAGEVLWGVGDI